MDASKSPPGSVRRAGRNISHPMPRRSTKGPLETAEDPLSSGPVDQQLPVQTKNVEHELSPRPPQAGAIMRSQADTLVLPSSLRFLQNPALYHRVPTEDVPQQFLKSSQQPPAGTSLTDLLAAGHYRRAAEVALHKLLDPQTVDASIIFQLIYCRLACLTIIARPDIAADEASPLLDFLASNALGASEVVDSIPWPLRVLLVRLQSIGAQDGGRRAIMALFNLAAETRAHIKTARESNDVEAAERWTHRLADLGLRISDTLVEMGELETARRHLDSLSAKHNGDVSYRKVLLLARLGDIAAARSVVESIQDEQQQKLCETLITAGTQDAAAAAQTWRDSTLQPQDEQVKAQNHAAYLLYSGHIDEGISLLESLTRQGHTSHTLLSNLSTMYELSSENASGKKLVMIDQLSSVSSTSSANNWERTLLDFKL